MAKKKLIKLCVDVDHGQEARHPATVGGPCLQTFLEDPLEIVDRLEGADALMTWDLNRAAEALQMGVPVVWCGSGIANGLMIHTPGNSEPSTVVRVLVNVMSMAAALKAPDLSLYRDQCRRMEYLVAF